MPFFSHTLEVSMTPLLALMSLVVMLNLVLTVGMLHAFFRTMRGEVDSLNDEM